MNIAELKERAAAKAATIKATAEEQRRQAAIENHLQALKAMGVEVVAKTPSARRGKAETKEEGTRRKGRSRRSQYEAFVRENPGRFGSFRETLSAFYSQPYVAGGSMRYCCYAFCLALQGRRAEARQEWERSGYPLKAFKQYWDNERKLLGIPMEAWPVISIE
jgi:hypothetical protein